MQEIFVDVWASAARFDESVASETTFVAMIARRRLIDRLRKRKREPATEPLDSAVHGGTSRAAADIERSVDLGRVRGLLGTLRPEQRKVLQLSIDRGWSHREISEAMKLPLGTVKTHVRRGLLRLRETLMGASTEAEGKS